MVRTYEVEGIELTLERENPTTGEIEEVPFKLTKDIMDELEPDVAIDTTPNSAFDRYALELSLESLLKGNYITFDEYVEALPVDSVMPKPTLESILKKRKATQEKIAKMKMAAYDKQSIVNDALKQEKIRSEQENPANIMEEGAVNEMQPM
jgi:hypothetical protein